MHEINPVINTATQTILDRTQIYSVWSLEF